MKKISFIILIIFLNSIYGEWKNLTIKDAVINSPFEIASLGHWKWIPESDEYLFLKTDSSSYSRIYRYNLATGDTALFISDEEISFNGESLVLSDFIQSPVGEKILFVTEQVKIWRHSKSAIYYLYDITTGTMTKMAEGARLRNVKFSPNGDLISYVNVDNNLYVYNIINQKETRLTKDGSFNVMNGHFGWVYEEEFGSFDSYRWSPDSKYIAFIREDQTYVKQFPMMDELGFYPIVYWHHYPKVGEQNPIMNIGIVNVNNKMTKWLDLSAPEEMYYPRINWLNEAHVEDGRYSLLVTRINRYQNSVELVKFNTKTRKGNILWKDESKAWVDLTDDIYFLNDGSFITLSERSGFQHIYHFDNEGQLINQITKGNWEVSGIIAFDEVNSVVYLNGKKDSVLESNLYSVRLDGTDFLRRSDKYGWHTVYFSPTNNYYIDSYSTVNSPLAITVHRPDGSYLRDISITNSEQFDGYGFSETKFIQIPTSDNGTILNASITLPRDFDPSKKYPVIVFGYSGPGSQTVENRQGRGYWNKYMNQEGYIYFSIDPRGTGGRGTEFKYLSYLDIGKWVTIDQVEGAKYLKSLPYVDGDRIGIWGWSGGGTMTGLCMTQGAPHFAVGVAVAGNYDLKLYDTIWTERYMGLFKENEKGYQNASMITYADKLEGKLLVVHGTMDDNVHLQHATHLMEAFVLTNKHADFLTYANRNHRINTGNATFHLWTKITNYFKENL